MPERGEEVRCLVSPRKQKRKNSIGFRLERCFRFLSPLENHGYNVPILMGRRRSNTGRIHRAPLDRIRDGFIVHLLVPNQNVSAPDGVLGNIRIELSPKHPNYVRGLRQPHNPRQRIRWGWGRSLSVNKSQCISQSKTAAHVSVGSAAPASSPSLFS